jgi:2-dehydropantoate 2-reductase
MTVQGRIQGVGKLRILVVGAGGVGGYFGGRLLAAKRDVTFLVRPRRAELLAKSGLVIRSRYGDVHIPAPPTVQAPELRESFDLILLSCKAYDLDTAIESLAPAVGPQTAILPLLNGMRHLDVLEAKFGRDAVLGGHVLISAALDAEGRIHHFNDLHAITFGERSGTRSARVNSILNALGDAQFNVALSDAIVAEMWEKWVFIATLAGITCLMRASFGDVIAAGGGDLSLSLLNECVEISTAAGYPPREESLQRIRAMATAKGSPLMASMLRDLERGAQTEVEQILGDLLRRQSPAGNERSLLRLAYTHVKAHEARRTRETSTPGGA